MVWRGAPAPGTSPAAAASWPAGRSAVWTALPTGSGPARPGWRTHHPRQLGREKPLGEEGEGELRVWRPGGTRPRARCRVRGAAGAPGSEVRTAGGDLSPASPAVGCSEQTRQRPPPSRIESDFSPESPLFSPRDPRKEGRGADYDPSSSQHPSLVGGAREPSGTCGCRERKRDAAAFPAPSPPLHRRRLPLCQPRPLAPSLRESFGVGGQSSTGLGLSVCTRQAKNPEEAADLPGPGWL